MKTILITQITLLLFVIPNFGWAQYITVSGYVNDAINGNALENVSIFEANSGIGTISNHDGYYKLVLDEGTLHLNISESGFKDFTQKFSLKSDTTLIFVLQPDLDEKLPQKKNDHLGANIKSEKKLENRNWLKLF